MSTIVKYLYHSGFTVETENYFIVFDYYKNYNKLIEDIKNSNKKVLIFSSHSHYDHFNIDILNYLNVNDKIKYIFSDDIKIEEKYNKDNIFFVKSGYNLTVEGASIKVFDSTDLGVSFLISVDNKNIFHSGDLNFWNWEDDTLEEKLQAEIPFKSEIEKIKGEEIDIAFFPVDPRLEENYYLGGSYFIENVKPKHFIPMHFQGNYEILKEFKNKVEALETNIYLVSYEGEEFIIN